MAAEGLELKCLQRAGEKASFLVSMALGLNWTREWSHSVINNRSLLFLAPAGCMCECA